MSLRSMPVLVVLALSAGACDNVKVEPLAKPVPSIDDRVTLRGQVCTKPPDANGFPVKVLFLIDRSGSMCITDPPGSEGNAAPNSLCQTFQVPPLQPGETNPNNYCEPDGNAHPGRVCAIYQLLQQFQGQPNVQAALVPFDVTISGYYPDPASMNGAEFAPVNSSNFSTWVTTLNAMQGQLGNGTDYQGAFAEAYRRIASDITNTIATSGKTLLPRTRYVIVFLTDGVPFPRCCADSDLPPQDYASTTNPDGIWPNSPGAGCPAQPNDPNGCFCTADQAYINMNLNDTNAPFSTGTDRNQNYQIYNEVDQILSLKNQYDIADMKLHAILTWNWGNIGTLSLPEQQDIFGDVGQTDPVQAEHDDAVHLLQEIALVHGNGTYQEFNDVVSIQLGALNYTSLQSPYVLKNFIVENINTRPGVTASQVDTDGEGLIDTLDNTFTAGTNKFITDTDNDGFDDHFEYTHQMEGFNPIVPDARGVPACQAQMALWCSTADTDGDGLSAVAENYLGTDSTIDDSDTDGIPDGMEVKYGMNPAVFDDPLEDTDGDGLPDILEIKNHSDPMVADAEFQSEFGYRYQITPEPPDGGVTCYDFAVSNVHMVTTQSANGVQEGFNVIKLWFDQAPQANVTLDYGEWKEACVVTQFAPPTRRVPAGPEVDFTDANFVQPFQITPDQYSKVCTPIPN